MGGKEGEGGILKKRRGRENVLFVILYYALLCLCYAMLCRVCV